MHARNSGCAGGCLNTDDISACEHKPVQYNKLEFVYSEFSEIKTEIRRGVEGVVGLYRHLPAISASAGNTCSSLSHTRVAVTALNGSYEDFFLFNEIAK